MKPVGAVNGTRIYRFIMGGYAMKSVDSVEALKNAKRRKTAVPAPLASTNGAGAAAIEILSASRRRVPDGSQASSNGESSAVGADSLSCLLHALVELKKGNFS